MPYTAQKVDKGRYSHVPVSRSHDGDFMFLLITTEKASASHLGGYCREATCCEEKRRWTMNPGLATRGEKSEHTLGRTCGIIGLLKRCFKKEQSGGYMCGLLRRLGDAICPTRELPLQGKLSSTWANHGQNRRTRPRKGGPSLHRFLQKVKCPTDAPWLGRT